MASSGLRVIRGPQDAFGQETSLIQNRDGFWNATAMGKQGGKPWNDFHRGRHKQYIEILARELGVETNAIVKRDRNAAKGEDSTWIHERIALYYLGNLSPGFAVWAYGVLSDCLNGKMTTDKLNAMEQAAKQFKQESLARFEQSQKQLQATQTDLKFSEGRRLEAEATAKKFWRQVDQATAETDDLKRQLGMKRQTAIKRKRTQDGKHFLQEVSRAIMEYRDGVPGPWSEVEDRLEKSVPEFLDYLRAQTSSYGWVGQDLSKFGELPTKKGNPKQWNLLLADPEQECSFDNIVPARNHETRGKLWQAPADGMEDD